MKTTLLVALGLFAFCFSASAPLGPGNVKQSGFRDAESLEKTIDTDEKGKTFKFPDLIQTVPGTIGSDDKDAIVALQRLVKSQRQTIDAQKVEIARLTQELKACQKNP